MRGNTVIHDTGAGADLTNSNSEGTMSRSNTKTRYKLDDDMNEVLSSLNEEIEQLSNSLEANVTYHEFQGHRQRTPPRQTNGGATSTTGSVDYSSLLEGEDFVSGSYEDGTLSYTRSRQEQQQQPQYYEKQHYQHQGQYYQQQKKNQQPQQSEPRNSRTRDMSYDSNLPSKQQPRSHQKYHVSTVDTASADNSVADAAFANRKKRAPSVSASASTIPTQSRRESFVSPTEQKQSQRPSHQAQQQASYSQSKSDHRFTNDRHVPPPPRNHIFNGLHSSGVEESIPQEPPGVVSPPFRLFSPSPTRKTAPSSSQRKQHAPTNADSQNRNQNHTPSRQYDRAPVGATPVSAAATSRRNMSSTGSHRSRGDSIQRRGSEWRPMLESVQWTLKERDERIAALEDENDDLYAQVQHLQQRSDESAVIEGQKQQQQQQQTHDLQAQILRLQQQLDAVTLQAGQQHAQQRRSHQSEYYDGRRPPASATTARSNTTPRVPSRDTNSRSLVFSPGTHFVAELAARTNIEVGHHAHLSFIIDEYWDEFVTKHGRGEGPYDDSFQ